MIRLALVLFVLALGTAPAAAEGLVYPPGSRVGLVPPPDTVVAGGLTGFRNVKTGSAILVIEMPAEAYPGLAATMSDESLKAQGFTPSSRETLRIGSGDAILIGGRQVEGGRTTQKVVLVVPDMSITALVIGQLPATATAEEVAGVQAALRTVSLRPPLTIDEQLASLPFRIRDAAGFRPVRAMAGNSLFLTDGPSDVIREASQPVLIVAESFARSPPAAMRETFARQALIANTFIRDATLERSQSYRQGGVDWHEIVAKATDATWGTPVIVMQTIRFGPDSYVRAVGVVRSDQRDAVLPRFRAAVDSITPQ